MEKMKFSLLLALIAVSVASVASFSAPSNRLSRRHGGKTCLSMALMDQAPPVAVSPSLVGSFAASGHASMSSGSQYMSEGIGRFVADEASSTVMTSTNVLSLKERPPPPTAEEIAAKKTTFNLWFWGGGFVAPFLATFYYFGLQFWKR